jgi:hypothetical protein
MPDVIFQSISRSDMLPLNENILKTSIGENSIIYSHNTFPSQAQKYHAPMWDLPSLINLESEDVTTIKGNRRIYEATAVNYKKFASDLLVRLESLNAD